MKQQIIIASKFLALAGVYLFTRSRTPPDKLRYPERSIAVLFLLENLKRMFVYNVRLIEDSKNQVEILEDDIRLFKAFLKDWAKRSENDEALEELAAEIQQVVAEAEAAIAVFSDLAAENRNRSFIGRAFGGSIKRVCVAKEVRALRAKVKNIYEKSRDVLYHQEDRRGGG